MSFMAQLREQAAILAAQASFAEFADDFDQAAGLCNTLRHPGIPAFPNSHVHRLRVSRPTGEQAGSAIGSRSPAALARALADRHGETLGEIAAHLERAGLQACGGVSPGPHRWSRCPPPGAIAIALRRRESPRRRRPGSRSGRLAQPAAGPRRGTAGPSVVLQSTASAPMWPDSWRISTTAMATVCPSLAPVPATTTCGPLPACSHKGSPLPVLHSSCSPLTADSPRPPWVAPCARPLRRLPDPGQQGARIELGIGGAFYRRQVEEENPAWRDVPYSRSELHLPLGVGREGSDVILRPMGIDEPIRASPSSPTCARTPSCISVHGDRHSLIAAAREGCLRRAVRSRGPPGFRLFLPALMLGEALPGELGCGERNLRTLPECVRKASSVSGEIAPTGTAEFFNKTFVVVSPTPVHDRSPDITPELLSLHELSLTVGRSLESREACREFLRALAQRNLCSIACGPTTTAAGFACSTPCPASRSAAIAPLNRGIPGGGLAGFVSPPSGRILDSRPWAAIRRLRSMHPDGQGLLLPFRFAGNPSHRVSWPSSGGSRQIGHRHPR